MLLRFPAEIMCEIAESCSQSGQAALALTCRRLYGICNRILYRADILHTGSRAVFHAITRYKDQQLIINTLEISLSAGADLNMPLRCKWAVPLICAELRSPIHLAASRGQDVVITFLLRCGISPNGPTELKMTTISPLFAALLARQEQTALLLLRSGASTYETNGHSHSCVHISVEGGLQQLTEYLIVDRKIDINIRNSWGKTPIMVAIMLKKPDAQLVQLSRLGADVLEALRQACHALNYDGAIRLLNAGGSSLQKELRLEHVTDLVTLVSTQGSRSIHKKKLIERLLVMGRAIADNPLPEIHDISLLDFKLS